MYNPNLAITDNHIHTKLVSHFNKIAEIANNKKFEWDDEERPEENYGITYNFDKWLESIANEIARYESKNLSLTNIKENTTNYVEQIKNYIDGFMIESVGIYNRNIVQTLSKRIPGENFDEVVKVVKELKENHKTLFLRSIFKTSLISDILDIDREKTFKHYYTIRYGIENVSKDE